MSGPVSIRTVPTRLALWLGAAWLFALGGGVAAGGVLYHFELWPHAPIHRALEAATRRARPAERVLRTQFLDFDLAQTDHGYPQTSRQHSALAVMGDGLLLLVNDDLAVLHPESLRKTDLPVELPDNGRAALEAAADPADPPPHILNAWHRYHDIEYRAPYLYLTYSDYRPEPGCFTSVLARLRLEGPANALRARAEDWETIAETSPCLPFQWGPQPYEGHQAGGRIALSPDGSVFWSVGDYGFDGLSSSPVSQDSTTDYGKIWRLGPASGDRTLHSLGHRNPQGLTVRADGGLWSTEHGPEGGDELNRIHAGRNYGWPWVTFGTDYGAPTWPGTRAQGRHDGFAAPAWAWSPSIGVAELEEVVGVDPVWDGDLLVTSLRARALFRVRTDGDHVVTIETIPLGDRIRDLAMHRGRVFLATDNGDVIRLAPRSRTDDRADRLAGVSARASAKIAECLTCHGPRSGPSTPPLCGVLGRRVGETPAASAALQAASGRWDRDRLATFLADTEAAIPGTAMPRVVIPNAAVRAEIVAHTDVFCP